MKTDELKPCPFCGGAAPIVGCEFGFTRMHYYGRCKDCGAQGPSFPEDEGGKEAAASAWNERALLSSALNPATELHAAIMNLPCKPYDGTDAYTHYCRGHRDARHAAAELVAASSALNPGAAAWQPIETAPKDGTEVLIWREDCGALMGRYCSANELSTMNDKERDELDEESLFQQDWWGGDADGGGYRLEGSEVPTHWMPLPSPPSSTVEVRETPADNLRALPVVGTLQSTGKPGSGEFSFHPAVPSSEGQSAQPLPASSRSGDEHQ